MAEILIRAQSYAFQKQKEDTRENYFLLPLRFRLSCNNKYLHIENSFSLKRELGWERKVTGPGERAACKKGCVNPGSDCPYSPISCQYGLLPLPPAFRTRAGFLKL